MTTTRVLVVGLGSIGQRHARLLSERAEVELHLCDRVADFRAQTIAALARPHAAEYDDYTAALAAQPNLVIIATPNHLHVPLGLQAVAAGADVLVEKPIADTCAEAAQLVDAAAARGVLLHVGYMLRHDLGLLQLKRVVEQGGIGAMVGGRAMVGSYITLLNAKTDDRERTPNSLIVDFTHELDFVRWIFGDVRSVMAAGVTVGALEKRPQPNLMQVTLTTTAGALVQVHFDYIQYPQRRIFEIYGDRGTLVYDFMTGEIRHFTYGRDHEWQSLDVPRLVDRWDDLFRAEHTAILDSCTNRTPPVVSGADGLAALRIAETAIAAASEARTTTL